MATISTGTLDNEGIAHLIGAEILDMRFVDVSKSPFANPDSSFTGYAADGFWYTDGAADPTHLPFKATWSSEGEHEEADLYRGTLDRFPDRIFVVTTASEVVILDADSLDVWMRFVPHDGVTAFSFGTFLGDDTTEIRQAAFIDGFLVVATSVGIRIGDFRNDRSFYLGTVVSHHSGSVTLQDRNVDGMLEAEVYTQYATYRDCLCVDVGVVGAAVSESSSGGIVVTAVGHSRGMTGIVLLSSLVSSPQAKEHDDFLVTGLGDWEAYDDNDGDGDTPYLRKPSGPAVWKANEVRVGDTLILTPSSGPVFEVTVTEVQDEQISVDPEVDLTDSGSIHVSHRPVPSIFIGSGGVLAFANGQQLVAQVSNEDWYTGAGALDPRTGSGSTKVVLTHVEIAEINKVRISGSSVYVATDQGVFLVLQSVFDATSVSFSAGELIYGSSTSILTPTYEILEGDISSCVDVSVDPETGNVMVSAVDGADCVVTEIDTSIHQAFQYFDQDDLGGVVNCIVSYRNTEGPPDDESEVA